jgi:2-methylcitrate dehydratase PrpD
MRLIVDPKYTPAFPQQQPVRLELTMLNGEVLTFYREEPVYLDRETVIAKLFEYCFPQYGQERVAKIVETIFALEKLNTVRELGQLLKP